MKITLGRIAQQLGLELVGDATTEISGIASLADAGPDQLTFLFNSSYAGLLSQSKAAAVVLRAQDLPLCKTSALISEKPRLTWAMVARLFDTTPIPDRLHHPTAVISETASLGENVTIGPHVVIENEAVVGNNVVLGAGAYVGVGSMIGEGSRLFANVTLYHYVVVGKNAIVHSGAVIGADGFGFEFDGSTGTMAKISQVYGVRIGDDVEIGAGSTIDRGALNHTELGDGVKLDNQVQIGHGTRIGDHTVMSGCTAVAGSTKIGSYCLIGGAVGIVDNIEIVDQVEITAMTLVSQSILKKGRYSSGTGLMPSSAWKRSIVGFSRLDEIIKRIRRLESERGK
ncbi:MAG: UDP-3-O-(3-hydroxymyristoyl)glucosamine N-acyltransferase [Pseudomonadales bacterium]